jgi:hypothetical protein
MQPLQEMNYVNSVMRESADSSHLSPRRDSLTQSSDSVYWHVCSVIHIFSGIFECLCSLRYDTSPASSLTGIWPNADKRTVHENVIIIVLWGFMCLLFTATVLFPICLRYVVWEWSCAIWQDLDYVEGKLLVVSPLHSTLLSRYICACALWC